MATVRTDIHRPSLLDPAEYSYLGCFYQGDSDAMYAAYREDFKELEANIESVGCTQFTGNHENRGSCDHCGAHFNHGAAFVHKTTNTYVMVGHICAADTLGLPSRASATRRSAEKAQTRENERVKRHAERAAWQAENTDVVEYLAALPADGHRFLQEMKTSLHVWGSLFPKQADAVRKFMKTEQDRRDNPPPPEVEPTTPLVEGRREITGKVLSVKMKTTQFGDTWKMLLKEADNNKVWGTVPEALWSAVDNGAGIESLRGHTVTLTAKVERSTDDEHFGFYSRPTKATVKKEATS